MNINVEQILNLLKNWGIEHGITVITILISTWLLSKFMRVIITKLIRKVIPRNAFASKNDEKKREDTLITIFRNFFSIFIWIAAVMGVLYEIGVPIGPLLTGAGILGVAVGFGSQSLVKDVISGLFIIMENQFRIDDYICVGEHCGTVEGMTLRVTRLRDTDGSIHYIPNGEIKVTSNKSRDYSQINLKIGVGYDTDFNILETVINRVGNELANDEFFSSDIIEIPQFLRIDDLLDSSVNVYIMGKVKPKQKHVIRGELLRRLKVEFDKYGIDIPYPTSVVYTQKK